MFKGTHKVKKIYSKKIYSKLEKKIYTVLGSISLVCIAPVLYFIIKEYDKFGGYFFEIRKVVSVNINFLLILILFLLSWSILEMIEYFRKRKGLIKTIYNGYYSPILAIFISSLLTAIAMESKNYQLEKYWIYANWPYQDIKLIGLPIVMLLTWPLHYIFFLSLMRGITNEDSAEIWADDTIN